MEGYKIEKVLDHRTKNGKIQYLIKWQGFEKKKDLTWEPFENLEGLFDVERILNKRIKEGK